MSTKSYVGQWHQIPIAVKRFLLSGLVLLVVWKVVYLVFLFPSRVLDAPLTHLVGTATAKTLNWTTHTRFYSSKNEMVVGEGLDSKPVMVYQEAVYYGQDRVVAVQDACNGLELFVLYAGFITCLPALLSRKLVFVVGGTALIFLTNVWRCAGITYLILYFPKQADFAHHYFFAFVVYALIIALWLVFSSKLKFKSDAGQ